MRGVYFLSNDAMLELTIAFLNSLRTFEPQIALCLIPYDAACDCIKALANRYQFTIWENQRALERCDAISRHFHSTQTGQYRKLVVWEGPYDEFVYIDVDTVLLGDLDEVFSLLASHDIITGVSNIPSIAKYVWKADPNRIILGLDTAYSANTGFIVSKAYSLTIEGAENKVPIAIRLTN